MDISLISYHVLYIFSVVLSGLVFGVYIDTVHKLRLKPRAHLSILVGLVCHGTQVLLAATLLWLPHGTAIRPMLQVCLMIAVAASGLVYGVPRAFNAILTRGARLSGFAGLALNLTSIITGILAMHGMAYVWNITLLD